MDAYAPIVDTLQPRISVPADAQPWSLASTTRTIFWRLAPAARAGGGRSSRGEPVSTFVIVDGPAHAGLERLRTFSSWQDNWDAEGSKAPDKAILDFASNVYGLLSVHRVPEVTLSADGHPMLIYGAPLNGEIIITGENTMDYFFESDEGPDEEGATLDEGALPENLTSYLHSAL